MTSATIQNRIALKIARLLLSEGITDTTEAENILADAGSDFDALLECDHCGEARPVKNTTCDYAMSFGVSPDLICEECYTAQPEPDTGRPDWDQL